MSKITTIITDLSEVLIPGFDGAEKIIGSYTSISPQAFLDLREKMNDAFLDTMRGKHTERQFLDSLLRRADWDVEPEYLGELIRRNFALELADNALGVIGGLRCKYRLVLLSDHIREWAEHIMATRTELAMFDEVIFSYELEAVKGDPHTFGLVLDQLQVDASECVFIDDLPVNVNSAKNYGINSLVYVGADRLCQELTVYGVKA